jgi:hypothetical protein
MSVERSALAYMASSLLVVQHGEVSSRLLISRGGGTQDGSRDSTAAQQRGELGAVTGTEFGAGAVKVVLNGANRDNQPIGDFAVGQSAGG